VQYGVNEANERHTAFDLSFSDKTTKNPMMAWVKAPLSLAAQTRYRCFIFSHQIGGSPAL